MDQNKLPSDDELDLASIIREFSGPEPDEAEIVPAPPAEESPMPSPITEEPFMDDDFREAFGEGESLEEVFRPEPPSEPSQEAVSDATCAVIEEDKFVEKGRPKKTGGYGLLGLPHLAAAAIWIALILGFGVMLGNWAWVCASDVLALGRQPITASVTIDQEDLDDIPAIAEKLKDAGLIKYPSLFKLYADITNAQEKIKAGTYQFTATNSDGETIVYDYMALMSVLSPRGNRLEVVEDLRIPEGYTSAQIFKLLEEKNVGQIRDNLVEKLSALYLLPYIKDADKTLYHAIEQRHSPEWRIYAQLANKRYQGARNFVQKLVCDKITQYIDHFTFLFDDLGNDLFCINRFGESGPAAKVAEHLGFTAAKLAELLNK